MNKFGEKIYHDFKGMEERSKIDNKRIDALIKQGQSYYGPFDQKPKNRVVTKAKSYYPSRIVKTTENQQIALSIMRESNNFHEVLLKLKTPIAKEDFGPLENFSTLQIDNFMATNLTSHLVITKLLLPHFKRIKIGDIIFIGSEAGLLGAKNGSLYCSAKFGLRGFSEALSKDVANKNIRVTIINAGMVRTDFFENLNFEPGSDEENAISIKDISSTVAYILTLSRNTIVDEVNLSPSNKAIKFK